MVRIYVKFIGDIRIMSAISDTYKTYFDPSQTVDRKHWAVTRVFDHSKIFGSHSNKILVEIVKKSGTYKKFIVYLEGRNAFSNGQVKRSRNFSYTQMISYTSHKFTWVKTAVEIEKMLEVVKKEQDNPLNIVAKKFSFFSAMDYSYCWVREKLALVGVSYMSLPDKIRSSGIFVSQLDKNKIIDRKKWALTLIPTKAVYHQYYLISIEKVEESGEYQNIIIALKKIQYIYGRCNKIIIRRLLCWTLRRNGSESPTWIRSADKVQKMINAVEAEYENGIKKKEDTSRKWALQQLELADVYFTRSHKFSSPTHLIDNSGTYPTYFDKTKTVDKDNWAVTMIASMGKDYFHAQLLVETVKDSGEYYKMVIDLVGGGTQPARWKNIINRTEGSLCSASGFAKIGGVQIREGFASYYKPIKHSGHSKTWVVDADLVQLMIDKAREESEHPMQNPRLFKIVGNRSYFNAPTKVYVVEKPLEDAYENHPALMKEAFDFAEKYKTHIENRTFGHIAAKIKVVRDIAHKVIKAVPSLAPKNEVDMITAFYSNILNQFSIKTEIPNNCCTWALEKLAMIDVHPECSSSGIFITNTRDYLIKK